MPVKPAGKLCRASAARIANGGVAWHGRDVILVRGKCHTRKCGSRFGVRRVTVDFTVSRERTETAAEVECVSCARRMRGCPMPARITHPDGALAVRLTLIVPSGEASHVYRAHGALRKAGDDQLEIVDADLTAYQEARDAWAKRRDSLWAARERRKARKAEIETALVQRSRALFASLRERDEEREREEREAAAREAAY